MMGSTKKLFQAHTSKYLVDLPSKHAQNEGEKHFNSNNSTERNVYMNELERFVSRIQPPPVINTLPNRKMGCSKEMDKINITDTGTTRA